MSERDPNFAAPPVREVAPRAPDSAPLSESTPTAADAESYSDDPLRSLLSRRITPSDGTRYYAYPRLSNAAPAYAVFSDELLCIDVIGKAYVLRDVSASRAIHLYFPEWFCEAVQTDSISDSSFPCEAWRIDDHDTPYLIFWLYPHQAKVHCWLTAKDGRRAAGFDLSDTDTLRFLKHRAPRNVMFAYRLYLAAAPETYDPDATATEGEKVQAILGPSARLAPLSAENVDEWGEQIAFLQIRSRHGKAGTYDQEALDLLRLRIDDAQRSWSRLPEILVQGKARAIAKIAAIDDVGSFDLDSRVRQLMDSIGRGGAPGDVLLIPEVRRGCPEGRVPHLLWSLQMVNVRAMTPAEQNSADERCPGVVSITIRNGSATTVEIALPNFFSNFEALANFVRSYGFADLTMIRRLYFVILCVVDLIFSGVSVLNWHLKRRFGSLPGEVKFFVPWRDNVDQRGVAVFGRRRRQENVLIPDLYFWGSESFKKWKLLHARDVPTWNDRRPMAIWRGATTGPRFLPTTMGKNPRINLVYTCRDFPELFDAKITGVTQQDPDTTEKATQILRDQNLLSERISPADFRRYQCSIDIDGNESAWGFFEKMSLGLCILKVDSPWEEWFYSDLQPWVHYVPIEASLDNLVPTMRKLQEKPDLARQIAESAAEFAVEREIHTEAAKFCRALANSPDCLIVDGMPVLDKVHSSAVRALRDTHWRKENDVDVSAAADDLVFSFRRDGNAAPYLADGWAGQEAEHVWSLGSRSSLCFWGIAADTDYRLVLDLAAFVPPPPHAKLSRLRVLASGEPIGEAELDGQRREIACELPRHLIDTNGRLPLVFEHPDFGRPSDHGHADTRELAMIFYEIRLVALASASPVHSLRQPRPVDISVSQNREARQSEASERIACLVLAHRAPGVLAQAWRVLTAAGMDLIVHLDAKDDLNAFRAGMGNAADAIVFLERRTRIFWGGFSMMEAEFALMEHALAKKYDRLLLISDDTFPLLPAQQIREALTAPLELITCDRINEDHDYWSRYADYWYFDSDITNPRTRGGSYPHFDHEFLLAMEELVALRKRGKATVALHHGSQFWCLRADTARQLLNYRSNSHFCSSLRFAALSDELMFPTIMGTDLSGLPRRNMPLYADFTRPPGPFTHRRYADILTENVPSDAAFIRKIAPDALPLARDMAETLLQGKSIIDRLGIKYRAA